MFTITENVCGFISGEDVSEAKDEGVLRSIIESGEGYSSPNDGAEVKGTDATHIDGLVQERRNSSALAMELHLACTNPLICKHL